MRAKSHPRNVALVQRHEATERVGAALSAVLAEATRSQTWLAARVGVSQTTLSNWCRGEALPNVAQLVAIDEAFEWPRGTLMRRAGIIELRPLGEVIAADPALDKAAKEQFLALYDELCFATLRRRQGRVAMTGDDTEELPAAGGAVTADGLNPVEQETVDRLAAAIAPTLSEAIARAMRSIEPDAPT